VAPSLGESAAASYKLEPASARVSLYVWSGNAELEYSYTVKRSGLRLLDRSAPLTGVIAMARDGLAALGRLAASAYPSGPRYVKPKDTCTLVRPATLARYGISETDEGGAVISGESQCAWGSDSVSISLFIRIESDPDGLGQQAGAVYQVQSGSPAVSLYLWSGNAEVNLSAEDIGFGLPLSRAGKLAAEIAMARDVLARLDRA
jgi:hypothetical protein